MREGAARRTTHDGYLAAPGGGNGSVVEDFGGGAVFLFVDVVVCTQLVEHSTVVLLNAVQVDVLLLALQNLSSVKQ